MQRDPPRIWITGLGLVSPLGLGAWPTFRALLAGRTLADRAARLPTDLDPVVFYQQIGRIGLACHAGDDPAVVLAELAAREAAMEAGIELAGLRCCIGTSKGAVHNYPFRLDPQENSSAERDPLRVAAKHISLGPHGYLTQRLREKLRLGLTEHYVAACASSLTALHHARLKMLQPGGPDAMLVVTAEAAILPPFIHSYRNLGVLAPPPAPGSSGPGSPDPGTSTPVHACGSAPKSFHTGPLDENRRGFMLSELAAAVVLCKHPRNPGARASLELVDTAIACDTFDLVRTDPRMPATRYLAAQLITEPMILHPHATGTRDNDEAEIRAISEGRFAIGDWYAVKGALGHGLGASGLVSLVVACCCARAGRRPPMPWLHRPLPPIAHQQSTASTAQSSEIENPPHAIFAAGFAGHAAAAVIRRQPNGFS